MLHGRRILELADTPENGEMDIPAEPLAVGSLDKAIASLYGRGGRTAMQQISDSYGSA